METLKTLQLVITGSILIKRGWTMSIAQSIILWILVVLLGLRMLGLVAGATSMKALGRHSMEQTEQIS
jgi:uncharacterized membrane protein YesL